MRNDQLCSDSTALAPRQSTQTSCFSPIENTSAIYQATKRARRFSCSRTETENSAGYLVGSIFASCALKVWKSQTRARFERDPPTRNCRKSLAGKVFTEYRVAPSAVAKRA